MPKPKTRRINKDRSKISNVGPKTRDLVECNCTLHCNGSKLVDPRTYKRHQQEMDQIRDITSGSSQLKSIVSNPVDVKTSLTTKPLNKFLLINHLMNRLMMMLK